MSSQSPNLSPYGTSQDFFPRKSQAFSYRPGQFIKHPFDPTFISQNPSLLSQPNIFKTSIVGNASTRDDEFYKSQVIERGIGGEPVYLNSINNYKAGTGAEDRTVMDQIRQEHVKIMNDKLNEAIQTNGKNAYQQVKTIIVEPLTEVVQLNVSTVQDGFQGIARTSTILNTTGVISNPSGRVSNLSIGGPINKRASQVQGVSRLQYVPYERKVTELQTREIHQKVPVEKRIIEYQDRIRIEQVPVQKSVLDYYAVEHITNFEPQIVQQKVVEMIPIERTFQTTNYTPVQKKIIHYPGEQNRALRGSIVRIEQPVTVIQNNPLRGSIISYKSPAIVRSNSVISNNAIVTPHKKIIRNSNELPNLESITSLSNNISPIKHQLFNIGNKGFQYTRLVEEPITYVHNAHILPFTNQLQQMKVVHQQPIYRNEPIIRHNHPVTRSVYPSPNQVQTLYQLPTHNYNTMSYSRPEEVVYQGNVIRRNLSGGSFINR